MNSNVNSSKIYPVYILKRVAVEIYRQCQRAIPNETLGRLLGYRCEWEGKNYIKIVDWVSGDLESGVTFAYFTSKGIQECETFLDERYGQIPNRPVEIGLFHSHPFRAEPHFSSVDHETFLTFPYDAEGNAFILIDPHIYFFKVFVVSSHPKKQKFLQQVPWIAYSS